MERTRVSVPPDAIRIEDHVWQEAFRDTTVTQRRPRPGAFDGRPARPVARATGSAPLNRTPAPAAEIPRRTVTITGRGAERNLPWPTESGRRRAARMPHQRAGFKPDRVAMWAVFLGVLLLLVAALSAHA